MANESLAVIGEPAYFVPDANEMQLTVYDRKRLKGHIGGWSLTSEHESFKRGTLRKY